ncbi:MAG: DEAD/DEAH box helicase [Desulfofustis sp.]|nr:DEAD/DEAH box helicase [Desulfofustis sp.]
MSFTDFNFNRHISEGLKSQGYVAPTPIQNTSIQPILDGRDLIGLAQTGTGKTAAFVLPILHRLSAKPASNSVQSLILTPTRELAEQIYTYIGKFSKRLNLHSCAVYGGVSKEAQIKKLRRGVDVVVACPGRLLDLAHDGQINLSNVETLVLDEADQMLDRGFLPDIKRIIELLPAKRQNLVFSATMPREVRTLVNRILVDPVVVSADHTKPIAKISHAFYRIDKQRKNVLLKSILKKENIDTAIVFTKTKYKARSLAQRLEKQGFKATSIQGNLSQQQRQRALDGFKSGLYDILVATDIAARGIDVAGISHIINYDMPGTTEAYTHRTGRTGRANHSGEALTFTTDEDVRMVENLRQALGGRLVYKNHTVVDQKTSSPGANDNEKNRSVKTRTTSRKTRGKRSSQ